VTWTTRLRKDAALYELPGPRTGKPGRPRTKGKRLPSLAALADSASFAPVTVRRYGKTATAQAAAITCLWHGVFGARPVQVVLPQVGRGSAPLQEARRWSREEARRTLL